MASPRRPSAPRRPSPAERARIAEIFRRFCEREPHPKTELEYTNAYTLVTAVALSAQATDKSVNSATRAFFPTVDTPAKMLAWGEENLLHAIKSIGLYRSKAKNVMAAARILVDAHGGEAPLERAALEALPGVGRKTASVVLNELGGEPAIAVDTHVFRVSHRLKLSRAPTPEKVEQDLMRIVPPEYLTRAHHWLILHGRYTCLARRPKCEACLIADLCPSRRLFTGVEVA
ncbi:MAG: endonuclease III [Caulobacteraceae bacterium]|nr:endonuclease III [Caulobacter sp.]